jgi:uncharacterized protein (DUF1684 family)
VLGYVVDVPVIDDPADVLDLLDWKREVFAVYERIRATEDSQEAWNTWRSDRDALFRSHPQSPLADDARERFAGLDYFPYNSQARLLVQPRAEPPKSYEIGTSGGGTYTFTRFASASVLLVGTPVTLELYWLDGYGGGLFLPFRDGTSGTESYGGGRYLLDTVKGADLGTSKGRLVLDFNFSYNPSCAYAPHWVCPLAPPPNRLELRIEAGETTPVL